MSQERHFTNRITAILANRNWHLVAQNSAPGWMVFVDQVNDFVGVHVSDDRFIERAVTFAYCPILLAACKEDGSQRQQRGFEELWHWIYPRVYAHVGSAQDAEDVAQKILMRVYQSLHWVEKPHGFLGYVSVIIHRELIDYYRRKGRLDQFEQELSWKDGDNGEDDGMDDLAGPDSFLEADVGAAEEDLIRMIYDCMPKRNKRRADVFVALTLLGHTAVEMAESLQITTNAVYQLYFHATRDLPKHCPELIEFMLQQLTPSQRLSLTEGNS